MFESLKHFNNERKEKSKTKKEVKHRTEVYNYINENFGCCMPDIYLEEAELILNCKNQQIINKAFYQVKNSELKKFILLNLEDKKYLEIIVLDSNIENEFRKIAMIKLKSQKIFEKIIIDTSEHCSLRYAAAQELEGKDDEFWYNIIISQKEDFEVEGLFDVCFSKIKSQQIIANVVKREIKYYLVKKEYDKIPDNFGGKKKYYFEATIKKIYAVKYLEDQDILKDLIVNYELDDEVQKAIIQKLQKEEDLMELFRKFKDDSNIVEEIVSRIEGLNYTNCLLELVMNSQNKAFISRNIEKFSNKKDLCMIMEMSDFWYATALAEKRIKELKL